MAPRSTALPALLAAGLALLCPPAGAQTPPASLNLTPSQFPGVLGGPVRVGPMTLLNGTQLRYRVRPVPVLLGQRRDGGIFVREAASPRARAARFLALDVKRFVLVPGEARSVTARIRRVPRSGAFHGGVLFEATPARMRGSRPQITNILQLTASVLLDPVPSRRSLRFTPGAMRVESSANRRLRVLLPVRNRGNVLRRVRGRLVVRSSTGRLVSRVRLKSVRVLPAATVELRATISKRLRPGTYRLSAVVRGPRRPLRATKTMRLFGVNEVATRAARLVRLASPTAYRGEDVELKGVFRNTGNVPFAPRGEIRVRPVVNGRPGRVSLVEPMKVERAQPGEAGEATATVRLPGSAPAYGVTVRLLAGTRPLDSRDLALTPTAKPSLPTRIGNYVTDHALVVVGLLLLVIAAGALLGLRYVRRLKAEAGSPEG